MRHDERAFLSRQKSGWRIVIFGNPVKHKWKTVEHEPDSLRAAMDYADTHYPMEREG